jgi:uncharacterized protein (TIGR00251 family)
MRRVPPKEPAIPPRPVRITVHAKPHAKVSRITKAEGLSIAVSIAAPPVDGAANEELVSILAEVLRVPKQAVRIVGGGGSRTKRIDVVGLAEAELVQRLAAAL